MVGAEDGQGLFCGAFWGGDGDAQGGGVVRCGRQQGGGADDGLAGHGAGEVRLDALGKGGFFEKFGEEEDVGGAAARDGGDGVEEVLVGDPSNVANGFEEAVGEVAAGGGDMGVGDGDGEALPDGGGGVGHGADDGGLATEHFGDGVQGFAGHDGDEDGAAGEAGIGGQGLRGGLRFDGEDDGLWREAGRDFGRGGEDLDAGGGEFGGVRGGVDDDGGGEALFAPAGEQGGAHAAAADQQDRRQGFRRWAAHAGSCFADAFEHGGG